MKITVFVVTLLIPAFVFGNAPPTISGTPPNSAIVGQPYSFTPTVTDDGKSKLSFVIKNRPRWLSFSYGSGKISGTPTADNIGLYSGIQIFVDDGPNIAVGTKKFSIAVVQPAGGSTTLSWTSPTKNTDGTSLANLAGYRIYYGTSSTQLNKVITVNSGALSSYVVDGLTPSTWYFAVTAFNANGLESKFSNIASKIIG